MIDIWTSPFAGHVRLGAPGIHLRIASRSRHITAAAARRALSTCSRCSLARRSLCSHFHAEARNRVGGVEQRGQRGRLTAAMGLCTAHHTSQRESAPATAPASRSRPLVGPAPLLPNMRGEMPLAAPCTAPLSGSAWQRMAWQTQRDGTPRTPISSWPVSSSEDDKCAFAPPPRRPSALPLSPGVLDELVLHLQRKESIVSVLPRLLRLEDSEVIATFASDILPTVRLNRSTLPGRKPRHREAPSAHSPQRSL